MEKDLTLLVERLIDAAEEKRQSEVDRMSAETARAALESQRLRMEQENQKLLLKILDDTAYIMEHIAAHLLPDQADLLRVTESILILAQVIAMRVGGEELDVMTQIVRDSIRKERGNMQVSINDRASVGNIVEGTQFNESDFVLKVANAINSDSPEEVENVFNNLPEDAADVALAATRGILAAAGVVVAKVAGKWRASRRKQDG